MERPSLPSTTAPHMGAQSLRLPDLPVLLTSIGPLAPQRSTDELRRKELVPVSRHPSGVPRSVPLERQTVVQTPAGPLPAELVTFYPSGALKRVFPLNGRLSGYWTQEDEASLAQPLRLQTPQGVWEASVISVCFHENGALRSVALWPDESVRVSTPLGDVETRMGVSFWPDGSLRSLEPAHPQPLPTPVGEVMAFDPDAVGVTGDAGSLRFGANGALLSLSTVQTCVQVSAPGRRHARICPAWRESLCGLEEREPVPLGLEFLSGTLALHSAPGRGVDPLLLPLESCRTEPRATPLNPLPDLACGLRPALG